VCSLEHREGGLDAISGVDGVAGSSDGRTTGCQSKVSSPGVGVEEPRRALWPPDPPVHALVRLQIGKCSLRRLELGLQLLDSRALQVTRGLEHGVDGLGDVGVQVLRSRGNGGGGHR